MVQKNKWEDEEEASRAASSVSKSPDGNNRQEWKDAVSGQEDGKQRADHRVDKQEHMKEKQCRPPQRAETKAMVPWELRAHAQHRKGEWMLEYNVHAHFSQR